MIKSVLLTATMVAAAPTLAYGWNIVCGVSINLMEAQMDEKWDADSFALLGISDFYAGVSDLQRLSLEDGEVSVPQSLRSEQPATASAVQSFQSSAEHFARALEMADEMGLGDETGLGYLSSLQEEVSSIASTLEDDGHLPALEQLHAAIALTMEYVAYGVDLGQQHLEMGVSGHGTGGPDFILP